MHTCIQTQNSSYRYTLLQPMTFVKVTKPRINSSKATRRTVRVRSAEIHEHRSLVSGGDNTTQLQNEMKLCSRVERERILAELNNSSFAVSVTTNESLAMKADLNIPWSKLRVVRR